MSKREADGRNRTDRELVEGCIQGDRSCRELLYKRYFSYAMSVCIRYANDQNEAMEIVNDSYMKVLDSLAGCDLSRSFKPWYGRVLINTAIDNYRKRKTFREHLSETDIDGSEEVAPEIETELSANEILDLYRHLPENYKVTFNLFEIEGYSHREIAEMLGVTESTSRSTLTRAKKMLRELYKNSLNSAKKSHEAI